MSRMSSLKDRVVLPHGISHGILSAGISAFRLPNENFVVTCVYFSWGSFLAVRWNVKAQVIQRREKRNFPKINSNFLTKLPDLFAETYIFAGYIKLLCILLGVLCLYNNAKYTHFAPAISSSLLPSRSHRRSVFQPLSVVLQLLTCGLKTFRHTL